jgi:hypothetical protein
MATLSVTVQDSNNIVARVVPTPNNVITVNRGIVGPQGPVGPSGESTVGGYPVTITSPQTRDVLMFMYGEWVNIPQTEVTDGGNF